MKGFLDLKDFTPYFVYHRLNHKRFKGNSYSRYIHHYLRNAIKIFGESYACYRYPDQWDLSSSIRQRFDNQRFLRFINQDPSVLEPYRITGDIIPKIRSYDHFYIFVIFPLGYEMLNKNEWCNLEYFELESEVSQHTYTKSGQIVSCPINFESLLVSGVSLSKMISDCSYQNQDLSLAPNLSSHKVVEIWDRLCYEATSNVKAVASEVSSSYNI